MTAAVLPAGVTCRPKFKSSAARSWVDSRGIELVYASPNYDDTWRVFLLSYATRPVTTVAVTVDADRLDALAAIHCAGQLAILEVTG